MEKTNERFMIIKNCIEENLESQEEQCADDLIQIKNHQQILNQRYDDLLQVKYLNRKLRLYLACINFHSI